MSIGTAAPSAEEMSRVRHRLVQFLEPADYYSAALFEEDALRELDEIWKTNDYAVMCGGSMMYIDAVTDGLDNLPTISPGIREKVLAIYHSGGTDEVVRHLAKLDPAYLESADMANHRRLIHALEICMEGGVPYSSLRTGRAKARHFSTIKLAIGWTREEIFTRINSRTEAMMADGLEDEARALLPMRGCNALNTVGYKEMFSYFDGEMDRDTAVARIAKNTRVYAKKQMLWLRKDPGVIYLDPTKPLLSQALSHIRESATTDDR